MGSRREDPREWQWGQLVGEIERALRRSTCRQLGDAYLLATALLEEEHRRAYASSEGERSAWARDFGMERLQMWGRWKGEVEEGDPLHADASHWRPALTQLMFDSVARGGLGLQIEPLLLTAGVVAVGHVCTMEEGGGGGVVWMRDFAEARRRNPRLAANGAVKAAWVRLVGALEAAGAVPTMIEEVYDGGWTGMSWGAQRGLWMTDEAKAVRSTLKALDERELCRRRGVAVWKQALERCFPGVTPAPCEQWVVGGRDRMRDATGPTMVSIMERDKGWTRRGGERRWLARGKATHMPMDGDETGVVVGDDGWKVGHEQETCALLMQLEFDEDGQPVDAFGARLTGTAIAALPPALQLQARAAVVMAEKEAAVTNQWPAEKRRARHLNRAVQERNRQELAVWQARIGATVAYTVDASRAALPPLKPVEFVVSRSAVRHDGEVFGGRMMEPEGHDNYLGELAAEIDAAAAMEKGARVILVFDATSPMRAVIRDALLSSRRRQGRVAGEWLETLVALLRRAEVVVMLWQTSHVGSPVNEWADAEAEAAARAEHVEAVPRLVRRSCSLIYTVPKQSVSRWAMPLAMRVTDARLARTVVDTQLMDASDIKRIALSEPVQRTCDAVLAQRSLFGDEKRRIGLARRAVLGVECPFGCVDAAGRPRVYSWGHAQIECCHPRLREAREAWYTQCAECEGLLTPTKGPAKGCPHSQTMTVARVLRESAEALRLRSGKVVHTRWTGVEFLVRRLVGGLVMSTGDSKLDSSKEVGLALARLVAAGAAVQSVAKEITMEQERAALEAAADIRKSVQVWQTVAAVDPRGWASASCGARGGCVGG